MNGKTAKKILMRGRTRNFWGKRAYFKVRIPLSTFPEPCPPKPNLGKSFGFDGSFRRFENGKTYITRISEVSSGGDPTRDGNENYYKIRHLTCNVYGDGYKSYRWWEAVVTVYEGDRNFTAAEGDLKPLEILELSDDLADQYIAHKKWIQKYLIEGPTDVPVLDAFLDASTWAKTTYPEIKGDYAYITYSVKWFYPTRRAKFSNDIASAFRTAKKHKVKVRAIPSFGY